MKRNHDQGASPALDLREVSVSFGSRSVVREVTLVVPPNQVVAFVGPSGCGKSTLLKCLNRMNDLEPEARVRGQVRFFGEDIYGPGVDPVSVRRRIGMVFQKPTPFPTSIFDNVAFGPRVHRIREELSRIVEESLRQVGLWEEVNERLNESAARLSVGQQQRLCIARALSVGPQVLLMDEPTSELDPVSSQRIEELIHELKRHYTIVLVTHNLQQAARVSDRTAFFLDGELIEYGPTGVLFTKPTMERTEAYLTGRFE